MLSLVILGYLVMWYLVLLFSSIFPPSEESSYSTAMNLLGQGLCQMSLHAPLYISHSACAQ